MVEYVEDRKGHDRRYSLDDSRLRALGYRPAVPFEQGLADTVRWYADHPDWWKAAVANGGDGEHDGDGAPPGASGEPSREDVR